MCSSFNTVATLIEWYSIRWHCPTEITTLQKGLLTLCVRILGNFVLELLRREGTKLFQPDKRDVLDAVVFRVLFQHKVMLARHEHHLLDGPTYGQFFIKPVLASPDGFVN